MLGRQAAILAFLSFLLVSSTIGLVGAESASNVWVYPATVRNPTQTEQYTVPLHGGINKIDLILWNHDKNHNFTNGRFVMAIKSGNDTFTVTVNLAFEKQDLTGKTTPGQFPPGGIFPCPWMQYLVGSSLTTRQNDNGWQGPSDSSGISIIVEVNIPQPNSAQNVKLYFMAWGYRNPDGQYADTPYSHITQTTPVIPFVVPQAPYGTLTLTGAMIAGLAIYWTRKRKSLPAP